MIPDNYVPLLVTVYFLGINLWGIGLTLYDKRASRLGLWRIKERTLFLAAALGGSVAMLMTMRLVRHKTQKTRFMVGLPVISILQIALIGFYLLAGK